MLELHERKFPEYGFADHKGYGTARHLAAIARHRPVSGASQNFCSNETGQA